MGLASLQIHMLDGAVREAKNALMQCVARNDKWTGMSSLFGKLFRTRVAAPSDTTKLDGTSEAALARSLSVLPPDQPGWITFAEARNVFSTKDAEYAFGETDDDGRKNIERFAAHVPAFRSWKTCAATMPIKII